MNDQLPAIVVADRSLPATAAQMRAQVNRIQEVMQAVMRKDVHYGKIPGTPKETLYKPGAEVLCATFHIAPSFTVDDLSGPDFTRYRMTCRGTHQGSGTVLGDGMGECSSLEEKYKWRKAVSEAEFNAAPEDRRRIKYGKDYTTKQVRAEHHDASNTILKMGCKRALVAMALNVTAASDIFTQDIEDMPDHLRDTDGEEGNASPERLDRLVKAANEAPTPDDLQKVWKDGLNEVREAKDQPAYDALKQAVEARRVALKKGDTTKPATPPAEAPSEPGSAG